MTSWVGFALETIRATRALSLSMRNGRFTAGTSAGFLSMKPRTLSLEAGISCCMATRKHGIDTGQRRGRGFPRRDGLQIRDGVQKLGINGGQNRIALHQIGGDTRCREPERSNGKNRDHDSRSHRENAPQLGTCRAPVPASYANVGHRPIIGCCLGPTGPAPENLSYLQGEAKAVEGSIHRYRHIDATGLPRAAQPRGTGSIAISPSSHTARTA